MALPSQSERCCIIKKLANDDDDAGLVMSFRALVETMQFLGNAADFERR
jgi:hypothetical protein